MLRSLSAGARHTSSVIGATSSVRLRTLIDENRPVRLSNTYRNVGDSTVSVDDASVTASGERDGAAAATTMRPI